MSEFQSKMQHLKDDLYLAFQEKMYTLIIDNFDRINITMIKTEMTTTIYKTFKMYYKLDEIKWLLDEYIDDTIQLLNEIDTNFTYKKIVICPSPEPEILYYGNGHAIVRELNNMDDMDDMDKPQKGELLNIYLILILIYQQDYRDSIMPFLKKFIKLHSFN